MSINNINRRGQNLMGRHIRSQDRSNVSIKLLSYRNRNIQKATRLISKNGREIKRLTEEYREIVHR